MTYRSAISYAAVVLLGCGGDPRPISDDRELRGALLSYLPDSAATSEKLLVLWFFTTETCLKCQKLDVGLRSLQHQYKGLWSLHALHIGENADTAFSAGFLRRFGLAASIHIISRRTFAERFARNIDEPSLVVLSAREVTHFKAPMEFAAFVNHVEGLRRPLHTVQEVAR